MAAWIFRHSGSSEPAPADDHPHLAAAAFHDSIDSLLLEGTKDHTLLPLRDAAIETRRKSYAAESLFRTFLLACELCNVRSSHRLLVLSSIADIGRMASLNILPVRDDVLSIACELLRRLVVAECGSDILDITPSVAPLVEQRTAPSSHHLPALHAGVSASRWGGSKEDARASATTRGTPTVEHERQGNLSESSCPAPRQSCGPLSPDDELLGRMLQTVTALVSACPLDSPALSEMLGLLFLLYIGSPQGSTMEATCAAAIAQRTQAVLASLRYMGGDLASDSSTYNTQLYAVTYVRDICLMALGMKPRRMKWTVTEPTARTVSGDDPSQPVHPPSFPPLPIPHRLRVLLLESLIAHFSDAPAAAGERNPLLVQCLNEDVMSFVQTAGRLYTPMADGVDELSPVESLVADKSGVEEGLEHVGAAGLSDEQREDLFMLSQKLGVFVVSQHLDVMKHSARALLQSHTAWIERCRQDSPHRGGAGNALAVAMILSLWRRVISDDALLNDLLLLNPATGDGDIVWCASPLSTEEDAACLPYPDAAQPSVGAVPPFSVTIHATAELLVEAICSSTEGRVTRGMTCGGWQQPAKDDTDSERQSHSPSPARRCARCSFPATHAVVSEADPRPLCPVEVPSEAFASGGDTVLQEVHAYPLDDDERLVPEDISSTVSSRGLSTTARHVAMAYVSDMLAFITAFCQGFAHLVEGASGAHSDRSRELKHIFISLHDALLRVSAVVVEHIPSEDALHTCLKGSAHLLRACCELQLSAQRDGYIQLLLTTLTMPVTLTVSTAASRTVTADAVSRMPGINNTASTGARHVVEAKGVSGMGPRFARWGENLSMSMMKFTSRLGSLQGDTHAAVQPRGAPCATPLLSAWRAGILTSHAEETETEAIAVLRSFHRKLFVLKMLFSIGNNLGEALGEGWGLLASGVARTESLLCRMQQLVLTLAPGDREPAQEQLLSDAIHVRDALRQLCLHCGQSLSEGVFSAFAKALLESTLGRKARTSFSTVHPSKLGEEGDPVLEGGTVGHVMQCALVHDCLALLVISLAPVDVARSQFVWSLLRQLHEHVMSIPHLQGWCEDVLGFQPTEEAGVSVKLSLDEGDGRGWSPARPTAKRNSAASSAPGHSSSGNSGPTPLYSSTSLETIEEAMRMMVNAIVVVAVYLCMFCAKAEELETVTSKADGVSPQDNAAEESPQAAGMDQGMMFPSQIVGPCVGAQLAKLGARLLPKCRGFRSHDGVRSTVALAERSSLLALRSLPFALLRDTSARMQTTAESRPPSPEPARTETQDEWGEMRATDGILPTSPKDDGAPSAAAVAATENLQLAMTLEIVREVLQIVNGYGGELQGKPWEDILQLLQYIAYVRSPAITAVASAEKKGRAGGPSDDQAGAATHPPPATPPRAAVVSTAPCSRARAAHDTEAVRLAFRAVEVIQNNCITSLGVEGLRWLIHCHGAFVRHQLGDSEDTRLHTNLTAVQLLWSVADYTASADLSPSEHSDPPATGSSSPREASAHLQRDMLWCTLLLELQDGCMDARQDIRQSAQRTLFSLVQTYGGQFSAECWRCVLGRVFVPLVEVVWEATSASIVPVPNQRTTETTPPQPPGGNSNHGLSATNSRPPTSVSSAEAPQPPHWTVALRPKLPMAMQRDLSPSERSWATGLLPNSQQTSVRARLRRALEDQPKSLEEMRITLTDATTRVWLTYYDNILAALAGPDASSTMQKETVTLLNSVVLYFIQFCGTACMVLRDTRGEEVALSAVRALHGLMAEMAGGLSPQSQEAAWSALERFVLRNRWCAHTADKQCTVAVVAAVVGALCDIYCLWNVSAASLADSGGGISPPAASVSSRFMASVWRMGFAGDSSSSDGSAHAACVVLQVSDYWPRLCQVLQASLRSHACVNSFHFPCRVQTTVVEGLKAVWPLLSQEERQLALDEVVYAAFPSAQAVDRFVRQDVRQTGSACSGRKQGQSPTLTTLKATLPPSSHPTFLLLLLRFLALTVQTDVAVPSTLNSDMSRRAAHPQSPESTGVSPVAAKTVALAGRMMALQYAPTAALEAPTPGVPFALPENFSLECLGVISEVLWAQLRRASSVDNPGRHDTVAALLCVFELLLSTATAVLTAYDEQRDVEQQLREEGKQHSEVDTPVVLLAEAVSRRRRNAEGSGLPSGLNGAVLLLGRLAQLLGEVAVHLLSEANDVHGAADVIAALVPAASAESPRLEHVARVSTRMLKEWSGMSPNPSPGTSAQEGAKEVEWEEMGAGPLPGLSLRAAGSEAVDTIPGVLRSMACHAMEGRARIVFDRYAAAPHSETASDGLRMVLTDLLHTMRALRDGECDTADRQAYLQSIVPGVVRLVSSCSSRLTRTAEEVAREREIRQLLSTILIEMVG